MNWGEESGRVCIVFGGGTLVMTKLYAYGRGSGPRGLVFACCD